MLRMLERVLGEATSVPYPLLGLIPSGKSFTDSAGRRSKEFQLENRAANLEDTTNTFVRVSRCQSYPIIRRASRLSYVIWSFLRQFTGICGPTSQELLESTSLAGRLSTACELLCLVNQSLKKEWQ